jgi:hypothetical protein
MSEGFEKDKAKAAGFIDLLGFGVFNKEDMEATTTYPELKAAIEAHLLHLEGMHQDTFDAAYRTLHALIPDEG